MSIRPLPRHVAEQIKSSVIITSLNDVVSGLVKNSLDAETTVVNVYLDYVKGGCTVEDNGDGILPSEFHPDGGLGKTHHTSKLDHPSECHGSAGDFLAAVATLSLLGITSHHRQHYSHNSLAVHHSAVISRHTPALPEQRLLSFNHGTRVSVRDLFGSMPVRVKQRPTAGDRAAIEREWRRLLRDVVGLLLPWRRSVSVYLRETSTGLELRFRPPQVLRSGPTSGPHDLVSRVSRTLTQANLADPTDAESWEKVDGSTGGVSVTGCVSLNPVATRRSQFICLGIQTVPGDTGSSMLYDEVNRVFSNSSFALDEDDGKGPRPKGGFFGSQKPRRGIDRWPMFYFRVDLADQIPGRSRLDQVLDHGHRVEAVADLLKAVCYEFLRKHHFNPRPNHSSLERWRSYERGSSPSHSRLLTAPTRSGKTSPSLSRGVSRSPFDMWSRVKAGKPVSVTKPDPLVILPGDGESGAEGRGRKSPVVREPLLSREGKLLRPPFPDALGPTKTTTTPRASPSKGNGTLGVRRPRSASPESPRKRVALGDALADVPPHPHRQDGNRETSEWVSDILKTWKNPVFAPVQSSIPRTYGDAFPSSTPCGAIPPGTSSVPLQSRISRDALRNAEVISQVDKKFILVKVPPHQTRAPTPTSHPSLLVLIDQHAADERCRLEDLARAYFTPSGRAATEPAPEPIRFEVGPREGALLLRSRGHLARWGVLYDVVARTGEVAVAALPPSILERCRQEPRLLIELLRAEAWRVDERGVVPEGGGAAASGELVGDAGGAGAEWARLLHGCPRGILDLLNSRACRSAIMFNDPLTPPECASLVSRLASCALPFQCAHGRPSMVPLLDLGGSGGGGGGCGWRGDGFSRGVSYKSWLGGRAQGI